MRTILTGSLLALLASSLSAEVTAGFEGSSDRGYAYLTWTTPLPLGNTNDLLFWATGSYLYYETSTGGLATDVKAPGLGAGVLYRWRVSPTLAVSFGPGYEYRWTEREIGETEISDHGGGAAFQGNAAWLATPKTHVGLSANYFGASEWIWTRASLRQELSDSLRAGPEIGFQGNDDVDVMEYGAIVEIPYGQNWLYIRAGQARESYPNGVENTRPYFSAGVSRSF